MYHSYVIVIGEYTSDITLMIQGHFQGQKVNYLFCPTTTF